MTRWMTAPCVKVELFDQDASFLLVLARNPFQSHKYRQFRRWYAKTMSKEPGTHWAVSEPQTSRSREPDGGVIGIDPALASTTISVRCLNKYVASVFSTNSSFGWLWTTSTDVSPDVLTLLIACAGNLGLECLQRH